MGISKGTTYFVAILFGFALLFPGSAIQYSYGDIQDTEAIKKKGGEFGSVKAEITIIKVSWQKTPADFHDPFGWGDGEIMFFYQFYEPGHSSTGENEGGWALFEDLQLVFDPMPSKGGRGASINDYILYYKTNPGHLYLPLHKDYGKYNHATHSNILAQGGELVLSVYAMNVDGRVESQGEAAFSTATTTTVSQIIEAFEKIAKIKPLAQAAGRIFGVFSTIGDLTTIVESLRTMIIPGDDLGAGQATIDLSSISTTPKTYWIRTAGDTGGFVDVEFRVWWEPSSCAAGTGSAKQQDISVSQQSIPSTFTTPELTIPDWIKNNAEWWADGLISDSDFVNGIEYMIENGLIKSPTIGIATDAVSKTSVSTMSSIPPWIKSTAEWWADDLISDEDFTKGIEYLVEEKIIKSPKIVLIESTPEAEAETIPEPVESTPEPVVETIPDPATEDVPSEEQELEPLIIDIKTFDDIIEINESVRFQAGIHDGKAVSYEWDFGDGSTNSNEIVSHSYSQTGEYDVTLTVEDENGQTQQVTITVNVIDPTTQTQLTQPEPISESQITESQTKSTQESLVDIKTGLAIDEKTGLLILPDGELIEPEKIPEMFPDDQIDLPLTNAEDDIKKPIFAIPQEPKIEAFENFPWYKATVSWQFQYEDGTPASWEPQNVPMIPEILNYEDPDWSILYDGFNSLAYDRMGEDDLRLREDGNVHVTLYTPGTHTLMPINLLTYGIYELEGEYLPQGCELIEFTIPQKEYHVASKSVSLISGKELGYDVCEKATWTIQDEQGNPPTYLEIHFSFNDSPPFGPYEKNYFKIRHFFPDQITSAGAGDFGVTSCSGTQGTLEIAEIYYDGERTYSKLTNAEATVSWDGGIHYDIYKGDGDPLTLTGNYE